MAHAWDRLANDVDDGLHPWEGVGGDVAGGGGGEFVHPWEGGDDSDSDDENPHTCPDLAGREFVEILLELNLAGNISAQHVCVLCYWAKQALIRGDAAKYAKPPGAPSGHYRPYLDKQLGLDEFSVNAYQLEIVGQSRAEPGKRVSFDILVNNPHECLMQDFETDEQISRMSYLLQEAKRNRDLPECYYDNPIVQRYPDHDVYPLGIYVDGVPYSKTDGVVAFWLVNLLTQKRDILCIVRKRIVCACGCRGWCTFFPIMQWLHDAFAWLNVGAKPTERHDGKPWKIPNDIVRSEQAGGWLPFACLEQLRMDWAEQCERLGYPTWASNLRRCLCCNAFGDAIYETVGHSADELAWHENTDDEYSAACDRCEIRIELNLNTQRAIGPHLCYDKGSRGVHGRYICLDLPDLGLQTNDRLEPSRELQDVGKLETIDCTIPFFIIFWRVSMNSICTHRSPLWDPILGIVPSRCVCIDVLHAFLLGCVNKWCATAIWALISNNAWARAETTANARLQISTLGLKAELFYWYEMFSQQFPGVCVTRLGDLIYKMLGTEGNQRFKAKAMETWWCCIWLTDMLSKYRGNLADDTYRRLSESGRCLQRVMSVMKNGGTNLQPSERQATNIEIGNQRTTQPHVA